MRSIGFTLLLLVLTAGVTLLAALRIKEGSLDRLFGSQAVEVGKYLYKFETKDIHRILLSGNGVKAECVFEKGSWHIVRPWKDRMDPRVADLILQFTLGTQVVDIIPEGKLDSAKAGLRDGTIGVLIEDKKGEPLARYLLGRTTQWVQIDKETGLDNHTVFLQPQDEGRGNYTYASTGDIHPLFRDGMRHLRDHHPFLFNPSILQSVRIQDGETEILLSHGDPKSPWRITHPVELRSDPAAVKKLIEDLIKLRALRVFDRSEVTLPAEDVNGRKRIAVRLFGQEEEVIVEIMPPATPEADVVFATASDRPGTVFELPLKPVAAGIGEGGTAAKPASTDEGLVSLAGLPDTISELRNPMLTNLDPAEIEGILINSATGPEILVSRKERGADWEYRDPAGRMQAADYGALLKLVAALTQTKVAEFVTDTAVNLAPYGLDRPSLSLRFASFGNQGFELVFGRSRDGTWYAMRSGVPTVMKMDDEFIRDISTQMWQWRQTSLWAIPAIDVKGVERTMKGRPPLELEYSFVEQLWKAREGGVERGAELVTERANQLLKLLLELQGESWVAPDDVAAQAALASPTLRFTVTSKKYDANGAFERVEQHVMSLAPASEAPNNQVYYGRVDNDPNAFKIDTRTVQRLQVDLFGDD